MADIRISELPPASSLSGAEMVELVQGQASRRGTVSDIAGLAGAGLQTIWLPAVAFVPRLTNGPSVERAETSISRFVMASLDYDPVVIEAAQATVRMPKSWDRVGLWAEVRWTAGGGSGSVLWALRAVLVGNGGSLNQNFGTPRVALQPFQGVFLEHCTPLTDRIIPSGNLSSGDRLLLEIYRDPTAVQDTLAQDAKLLGVTLFYTASKGTDD